MMEPFFRICTLSDISLANIPFVKAYHFAENQEKMLTFYWSLQPDGWWVGFKDETPCAFGGAVDYGAFSSMGMLAVDPSLQNHGIGTDLVHHIMNWCTERSCPTILLEANIRTVSLYKRLGFVEEETTLQFQYTNSLKQNFSPSSSIEVMLSKDIFHIANFDSLYFGGQRKNLLSLYLKDPPNQAFLSRNNSGKITGYIFIRPRFIGPWVAETPDVAEKLLQQVLILPHIGDLNVTIPSSNSMGQELLKQYGFRERASPSQHMRKGDPIASLQRSNIFGQASMALG